MVMREPRVTDRELKREIAKLRDRLETLERLLNERKKKKAPAKKAGKKSVRIKPAKQPALGGGGDRCGYYSGDRCGYFIRCG